MYVICEIRDGIEYIIDAYENKVDIEYMLSIYLDDILYGADHWESPLVVKKIAERNDPNPFPPKIIKNPNITIFTEREAKNWCAPFQTDEAAWVICEDPAKNRNNMVPDPEDPTKMILKEDVLDECQIVDYKPTEKEKQPYEPKTLEEYIGQENSKDQIKASIRIINELKPIHILLNGWAGCGKTALARITANMLDANFIYRVPEQLKNVDDLVKVINEIQTSEKLTVFMLDEMHTIPVNVANVLLPILQDGVFGNKRIRPFVMIGATTDKDKLIKKQAPLVSRFQTKITLDKYAPEELVIILRKYHIASFPDKVLLEDDYETIAKNSRGIPREAIALLLQRLVSDNIGQVLKRGDIISDGLTKIDIKILKTLNNLEKPVGASYLSQAVGIPQADYEIIYERYLIEKQLVYRQARGRVISDHGKKFLKNLKGQTYAKV